MNAQPHFITPTGAANLHETSFRTWASITFTGVVYTYEADADLPDLADLDVPLHGGILVDVAEIAPRRIEVLLVADNCDGPLPHSEDVRQALEAALLLRSAETVARRLNI